MSERPTAAERPPAIERPAPRLRNVSRVLGHITVVIIILAVIAGAFALSYNPMRDIAGDARVAAPLVRIYPGIFDAVFLVACAAALMLRDARWWRRLYAWLSVLVTGALIGAADVYHATGLRLPHRTMAGTIAALPWALVLLGFSLWLSVLQQAKSGRTRQAPEEEDQRAPDAPVLALEATPAARVALPAPEPAPEATPAPIETGEADKPAEARETVKATEPGEAGETEVTSGDTAAADETAKPEGATQAAEPPAAEPPAAESPAAESPAPEPRSAADDDTPAYGFPAVSAQNGQDEAPRTPSLLSAPVPDDVVDRGAPDGAPPEQPPPAEPPAPMRFERVRSTPTPPGR